MISTPLGLDALTVIGGVIYESIILLLVLASLACSIVTLRIPRRPLVYSSTITLILAVLVAAFPGPQAPPALAAFLALAVLALATIGGGPLVQLVLVLATRGTATAGSYGGILVEDRAAGSATGSTREVLRGGTTIGYLERLATAGAIIAGFPEAIALLVAIKSVGRFSELDEAQTRERFIIGTLVSLMWACACAGIFRFATS